MGTYNGEEKKKGKGGHCRRYREDKDIEDLHGLYEEPNEDGNDDGCDDYEGDGDWDRMEEKEQEEEDDDDDDVVDITVVQLFGMPNEEFLGKETENKKKKEEEEDKITGNGNDGGKNSGGSTKKGKNMRGGIDRSASKGDNKDDADSWDKHDLDVKGREGAEW